MSSDLIRVILVDDHAVVRAGLKAVLGSARDIDVVGEGSNGTEAIALAGRLHPDVVVMDLAMQGMDGIAATKALASTEGGPRVLVLTMHAEEDYLVPLLEAGAAGYLVKTVADRELVDAVRTVARGELYVRPAAARILAKGLKKKDEHADDRARYEKLTDRERDVLRLLLAGRSGPEIADVLVVAPSTVRTHLKSIYGKLDAHSRDQAIARARELKLV
jgi:DNA-binding NarL/FixJ family response regulator